jgi:hypothetical protein
MIHAVLTARLAWLGLDDLFGTAWPADRAGPRTSILVPATAGLPASAIGLIHNASYGA